MEEFGVMKVEVETEECSICSAQGEELYSPEEHDAAAPPHLPPLRAMLLHLNHSKLVPNGRLCTGCIRKTEEAYIFSTTLASKAPPPLSEKIRALRKKLHELTQKIDVFIVVGSGGANGAYSEDDIIMVERDALAAATKADEAELLRAKNMKGESVYQCTVCPLTFQRASEYKQHAGAHSAGATHSCWTCGAQFASAEAVAAHALAHHAARPHCYPCDISFQRAAELAAHETTCAARCPWAGCGVGCGSRTALRAHAARHALLCARCFRPAADAADLHAHMLAHRQEKHFVCGYDGCILRFATRNNLVGHIRKCHGDLQPADERPPADAPVPCAHCTRTFASAAAMKRHARVHNKELDENKQTEDMEWMLGEGDGEGKVEYLEVETLEELEDSLQM